MSVQRGGGEGEGGREKERGEREREREGGGNKVNHILTCSYDYNNNCEHIEIFKLTLSSFLYGPELEGDGVD